VEPRFDGAEVEPGDCRDVFIRETLHVAKMVFAGSINLDKDWSLHGYVENVFDEQYDLVDDYTTPGRTVSFRLRYNPK